ncbi:hypothetical protein LVD17_20410 [Fulvivirga ulvae]|uniref:hypothetical protein n=1 Tax=Fulvivirga ulvae TaxID=2904245 RepID=UPI001F34A25D|nr:hypothetical protein [Fulvivirga ulvae]UII30659.1 hypothetical protein LVD17_20410 [Fulvivirga ulvae]
MLFLWGQDFITLAFMIAQIEKREIREQIMNSCIRQQQLLMDDFSQRIKSLLASQKQQTKSGLNGSKSLMNLDEIDLLNDAMIFAQLEMNRLRYLRSVNYMDHREVELGAIVITDVNTIFVSSSVEPFWFNGENIICISTESALFNQMKGKRTGELFFHNQNTYIIREIL